MGWKKQLAVTLALSLVLSCFPVGTVATSASESRSAIQTNARDTTTSQAGDKNAKTTDQSWGTPIATEEELFKIEENPNGCYYLTNDIYVFDAGNGGAHAICNRDVPFCGRLNGNGYTIHINIDSEQDEQGLFGVVGDGGVIENVGVTGNIFGGCSVGALAGCVLPGGMVEGCFAQADVYGSGEDVGGLVGCLYGQMRSCYFIGDAYGEKAVGGLCGSIESSGVEEDCYQVGAVYADDACGGAVGDLQGGAVRNCSVMQLDTSASSVVGGGNGTVTGTSSLSSATALREGEWLAPPQGYANENNDRVVYLPQLKAFVDDENSVQEDDFPQVALHDYGNGVTDTVDQYISTAQGLQDISNNLTGNYVITSNIDLSVLDEENQNFNFEPIGSGASNAFTGKLDGGGYQIQNLKIRSAGNYQGLFGYIGRSGSVQNVVLTGAVTGASYVGGIAGFVSTGAKVTHCENRATIQGDSYVGGVVGRLDDSGNVSECLNRGGVSGANSVGGIVGSSYAKTTKSANLGAVSARNNYMGGVVGYLSGKDALLQNCYNTAGSTGVSYVGGIVGEATHNSTVSDSYSIGNVTGRNYVGAVAGDIASDSTLKNSYYDIELEKNFLSAVGGGEGVNVGSLTTMQMTGSSAVGADGMFFTDPSVWTTTQNTDTDVYFPQLAALSGTPSPTVPYYQVVLPSGEGYSAAPVSGYDEDGRVIANGDFHFTVEVNPNGYSAPPVVKENGRTVSYSSVDGMTYTYNIANVGENKSVSVSVPETPPSGITISGQSSMNYNSSQQLTAAVSPDNILEKNRGVSWSVIEGTGKATLSDQSPQSVLLTATQAGSVTVRATSLVDACIHEDFAVQILQIQPSAVFPTNVEVTEGETLSQARISGQSGEGVFSFANPDQVVFLEDDGSNQLMYFTPTDAVNYLPLQQAVTIHVVQTAPEDILTIEPAAPVNRANYDTTPLVMKGSYQYFQLLLNGTPVDNQQVSFEVSGAQSEDTAFDSQGKLSISPDESSKKVTVSATIINQSAQSASLEIRVCKKGDFNWDTQINAIDYRLLNNEVLKAEAEDYLYNPFYDITKDGLVNENDCNELLEIMII